MPVLDDVSGARVGHEHIGEGGRSDPGFDHVLEIPMHQTAIPPPSWRAAALRRIEATNVAGPDTQHSRVMNPEAVHGLLRGRPDPILGIARFERIPFKDVLDAQASV